MCEIMVTLYVITCTTLSKKHACTGLSNRSPETAPNRDSWPPITLPFHAEQQFERKRDVDAVWGRPVEFLTSAWMQCNDHFPKFNPPADAAAADDEWDSENEWSITYQMKQIREPRRHGIEPGHVVRCRRARGVAKSM
jgi:hypothetical protein